MVDGVRRLFRGMRRAEHRTRVEAGLSAAQLFVLSQLADSASASLGALAERTLTDRSSVAAVLERLEEEGLVDADRAPEDRRRVVARITAAGRQKLAAAPPAPTSLLVSALARMPEPEVARLAVSLGHLLEQMGLADEPATMLFEERGARQEGGA